MEKLNSELSVYDDRIDITSSIYLFNILSQEMIEFKEIYE